MSETLTLAIIGHLAGDYLLQNDWMALNKKKESFPCVVHCWIWTVSVMWFSGWFAINSPTVLLVAAALFFTHFIQDRTQVIRFWMNRINRQPRFTEPPMAPWSLIVVDNVWHIVAIWAVWKFIV
jgi:hypothetical protein